MPLVTQSIDSLLNGVSEQAQELRLPSQGTDQQNGLSNPVLGLQKRPGTQHRAKLSSSPLVYASAFMHTINRSATERYRTIFLDGDVKVFDSNGVEFTVQAPDGKTYLATTNPSQDIRAVTVGETTFVTNRAKKVAKGAAKTTAQPYEALIVVRQGAFGAVYRAKLSSSGLGSLISVTHTTTTSTALLTEVSTETIATKLKQAIADNSTLNGIYTVTQYGSTLHIRRTDNGNFALEVEDGLGGEGLKAIKGGTQVFSDLPGKAPDGFLVQITGDPRNKFDNFWVKFDGKSSTGESGVWTETVAPNIDKEFDATTMPHELVRIPATNIATAVGLTAGANATVGLEGISTVAEAWRATRDGAADADTFVPILTADLQDRHANLSLADGSSDVTVRVNYDIEAPSGTVEYLVKLERWDGVAWVTLVTQYHSSLQGPSSDRYIQTTLTSAPIGEDIRVLLDIISGTGTPNVRFHAKNAALPGVQMTIKNAQRVTFDGSTFYCHNARLAFTVQGTVVNVDAPAAGYTPAQMCAAAAAAIEAAVAAVDVTDIQTLSFRVQRNPIGTAPAVSVVSSHTTGTTFYNSGLSLTPAAHIGDTVTNTTSGASGVISANTDKTVTSTLVGGARQTYLPGDVISITAGAKFIFRKGTWDPREVGDDKTNKMPSFVEKAISNVFYAHNRLGFTAEENTVWSRAGDLRDFFRSTVTDLRADDRIDLASASSKPSWIHSYFAWQEQIWFNSDAGQFMASGTPVFSPQTARLDNITQHETSRTCSPLVAGARVFMVRDRPRSVQVMEYSYSHPNAEKPEALDITKHVPRYLKGSALQMWGDDNLGVLFLLTKDGSTRRLFVLNYLYENGERRQLAWHEWLFKSGDLIGGDMIDGTCGLVFKRSDGIYLETVDLDVLRAEQSAPSEIATVHLDRRGEPGVTAGFTETFTAGGNTEFVVPWQMAIDGSEGLIVVTNRDTGAEYATQWVFSGGGTTTVRVNGINLTAANLYIGVAYRFSYVLSTLFIRDSEGKPRTDGRLQITKLSVNVHDTSDMTITVTPYGRTSYNTSLSGAVPDAGRVTTPVHCNNRAVNIIMWSDSAGSVRVVSVEWEGNYHTRAIKR